RDITKQFGNVTAVDAVSLDVPDGSIYGFIGPNGSGKTTTIRMIMNLLVPDRGSIQVLGQPPGSGVRDLIGYLPEERGLYKRMTARQVLRYYGQLKGRSVSDVDAAVAEWIEPLQVGEWLDKKVNALSKGMSQKVQFISTIVARPKLLILDEPFSGLDPVNADVVRAAVLELRRRGTTIVFSTHDMSTAERMCDRIFMIFQGKKVLDGSLDEIQARYGQDTIRVRTAAGAPALTGLAGIEAVTDFGNYQDVRFTGDSQAFLTALAARTPIRHFEVTKPSLNDIFVRIAKPSAAHATALAGAD
ncbi:MAG TPA: ATP-binding cassette domain-containing protein, partial [Vicinamibacterales bacterium]